MSRFSELTIFNYPLKKYNAIKTKDIWYFQAFNIVDSTLLCQESSYLLFSVKEMDDFLALNLILLLPLPPDFFLKYLVYFSLNK